MKAAFPRARYCLSSATLTDAYVKDILSTKALPGLTHVLILHHRVLVDFARGHDDLVQASH